ncbi:MAG: xanthine dehydrogenase family protein molybdopterin-binding subunit [Chloroflexota bacterium]
MSTPAPTRRTLGTSIPRPDAREKVTGAARYAADVALEGTLTGRVLRSPHPHARIVAVDARAARAIPGVRAVLTGADVAGAMAGRRIFDMPLLAHERVRFVGEPVAAVAAVDRESAERALAAIRVTYQPLPALLTAQEAMAPGAPLLHPDFNAYRGVRPLEHPSNVFVHPVWGAGDVEQGFAEAEVVLEGTYQTALTHQGYMEAHACTVRALADGTAEVWASNKAPHYTREQVALAAGLEPERVLMRHAVIGGDFGGKGSQMQMAIAYRLSRLADAPVRMVLDYAEELGAANPRHPAEVHVKVGAKRDGTLTAAQVRGVFSTGAYAAFLPLGFLPGPRHCVGPYRIPHARVDAAHVYTNRVPAGHMRGPGEPQAIFALESHLDEVAHTLAMDPADLRARNLVREGDANGLGERFEHLQGDATLRVALEASGYHTPLPARAGTVVRGRGVALGERTPGGGQTHAGVAVDRAGAITVRTSVYEQGSGTYTTLVQMCADALGVAPEGVRVLAWEPGETGFDSGAGASRNSRMVTHALTGALDDLRTALTQAAVSALGWPAASVLVTDGAMRRTDTGEALPLGALVERSGQEAISGAGDYDDATHAHSTAFTVQVAQVAVDTETGQVRLERLTSVHDAGTVLNPQGHEGQVRGGALQGVGYALMEELPVAEGRVGTLSLADYRIPSTADLPDVRVVTLEHLGAGVGPLDIKGIGENPLSPVAPAIANAIRAATGVRVRSLPLSAEKVRAALREAGR